MTKSDVIDKMLEAFYDHAPAYEDFGESGKRYLRSRMRAALKAVKATHRLVPIEPTEEIYEAGKGAGILCGIYYNRMVKAAPDYTESNEEEQDAT